LTREPWPSPAFHRPCGVRHWRVPLGLVAARWRSPDHQRVAGDGDAFSTSGRTSMAAEWGDDPALHLGVFSSSSASARSGTGRWPCS
jgi:hypothetical protein